MIKHFYITTTNTITQLQSLNKGYSPIIAANQQDKLGWLITGLVQSDGSFGMRIIKYKNSIRIRLVLVIEMTIASLPLLEQVRSYFGCGSINIDKKRNTCIFTITDLSALLHIVVPHFLKYPLFGAKYLSFYKFLRVLILIYPIKGSNYDKLTLAKAVYLGWDINGTSYRKEEELYNILQTLLPSLNFVNPSSSYAEKVATKEAIENELGITKSRDILNSSSKYLEQNKIYTINPYFILGVIEGDGSFYVGLRSNGKIRFGFNITTSFDDIMLLHKIKTALGCGNVKQKALSWCRYEVEGNKDLRTILMCIVKIGPFGDKLLGSKSNNYEIFRKVMEIFIQKGHMEKQGLRQIANLVYSGSTLKNRKLTLKEFLKKHNLN